MLEWEHSIYESAYPGDARLKKLLRAQLMNKGSFRAPDGRVSYQRQGGRMSGDINTSLGNVLVMSSMCFCYAKAIGLQNFEFIDDGDDCGFIVESEQLEQLRAPLKEWFLQLGFEMTVEEPVYELEKVVFCQSQPVWTPQGYVMVRQLSALSKDLLTTKPHLLSTEIGYDSLRKAIGDGGMALYGNIPLYCQFYEMMRRGVGKVKELPADANDGYGRMTWGRDYEAGNYVHPKTRASFYTAFGVIPDQQLAVEDEYKRFTLSYGTPSLVYTHITRIHL
jgi:hypothetical protein